MAPPFSGGWVAANANANDYSGALKWGTGVSPVYAEFGEGPPLGIEGRNPDTTPDIPYPNQLLDPDLYGYCPEDIPYTSDDAYMESEVPANNLTPEITRGDAPQYYPPPSLVPRPNGPSGNWYRSLSPPGYIEANTRPNSFPTETVTEGWDNKLSGEVLTAETSSPDQYERQTSMQQVNPKAGRNNGAAVARGTDEPRFNIMTRLTGMKIKPWSEGERLSDMFPFQQDLMLRPWRYRQAAVGRENWLTANEFNDMSPIQRDPPGEPDLGPHESLGNDQPDFGYAPEDWYG